jgi:very-short-patch-repair endonuclease
MDLETQKERTRFLRKNMTDSERKVWSYLSRDQMGVRFRRQVPMGIYIVDFVCFTPQLIVECDGGQHQSQKMYDQKRDHFLQGLGFKVLRFWNNDILGNMNGVFDVIERTINDLLKEKDVKSPPPAPSVGGGATVRLS